MSVSIAIYFYNAETFLADAIRSVFAQTYQDWELILIDDGSTDNSLSIAESIKDSRVRVFSDGRNKESARGFNEIAKIAKCDYIVRMDANDLMAPDRLRRQLEILENNKADVVVSGVFSVLNNLELVGVRGKDCASVSFDDILSKKIGITKASLMARKSWYLRNHNDETLNIEQDLDFWLRSSKNNGLKIISTKGTLNISREENNFTKAELLSNCKDERIMYRKYKKPPFNFLIIKSYLKSLVVILIAKVSSYDVLLKKRAQKQTSEKDIETYYNLLDVIKSTKVNGLDA
jgi:glycosyltransferase involved in cell wall biosynthesis